MNIFGALRRNEPEYYANTDRVDINIKEFGQNLRHQAIAQRKTQIALDLIDRGIDLNCQDHNGQTPLHFLGMHPNRELADRILESGGNLSVRDIYGNTPLWTAVANPKRDYDLIQVLVDHGADPASTNNVGKAPIDVAEQSQDERLKSILLSHK